MGTNATSPLPLRPRDAGALALAAITVLSGCAAVDPVPLPVRTTGEVTPTVSAPVEPPASASEIDDPDPDLSGDEPAQPNQPMPSREPTFAASPENEAVCGILFDEGEVGTAVSYLLTIDGMEPGDPAMEDTVRAYEAALEEAKAVAPAEMHADIDAMRAMPTALADDGSDLTPAEYAAADLIDLCYDF